MDCDEAARLLHPLADRELGLERSLEVEAHLDGCASCGATYRDIRALRRALRDSLPYEAAPDRLRERLRNSLPGSPVAPSMFPQRTRFSGRMTWSFAGALAAIAFGVLLTPLARRPSAGVPVDQITEEALSGHLRSLMGNHLADVMSSDQHTVKPYFAGKLDFSPPVINLAGQGFPLVAGRLDYIGGHPAAALVYRRNKHIINLFVWPITDRFDSEPITRSERGYQIIHWSQGGMAEWAVSDLNTEELRQFSVYLRRH